MPDAKRWLPARPGEVIAGLLFWAFFYLYLWRWVDLRLIYSAGNITNFPVFYKDSAFLRQCLALPGGFVDYLSAFLSQLFYYSWAGALVVTLQAWLICRCTEYILVASTTRRLRRLRFVPPILVLIPYARYSYHFRSTTALLVSLLLSCLYIRLASRIAAKTRTKDATLPLALFTALSLAAYPAVAGAYWLFAVLCALYECGRKRGWLTGLVYVVLAVTISYVEGSLLFRAGALDAYTRLLPLSWEMNGAASERMMAAVYALYLFAPVVIVLWHALRMPAGVLSRRRVSSQDKPTKKNAAQRWGRLISALRLGNRPALRGAAGLLMPVVIGGAVAWGFHDAEQKTLLAVHDYACRRMWPEVLETVGRHPTAHPAATNAVDRALYHTDRLPCDVFSFPQHPGALLLTGKDRDLRYWHKFDTLTDLGLLNLAEKNLTECIAIFGEQPPLLQRLASINLAKGRIAAAHIYLHRLAKTMFYDAWARDMLARLDSDPNLTGDSRIRHLRSVRLERDSTAGFYARENMLQALLESNRHNRMAFEYLTISYLLNRQLNRFIGAAGRLNDFGYAELPRVFQEALLIYTYGTKQPVYLPGHSLDPERRRQIENFSRIFKSYGQDKKAAFADLAERYGDSYFFYHIYGFSPGGK